MDELIQDGPEQWHIGKYYIYKDIDDTGWNDYTILYKDHGVQKVCKTLEEAAEWIRDNGSG